MPQSSANEPTPATLDLWSSIAPPSPTTGTPAQAESGYTDPSARSPRNGRTVRSRGSNATLRYALRCPADRSHGILDELSDGRLRCRSQEHDPRPATAAGGARAASPAIFTLDAAEAARDAHIAEEDTSHDR